MQHGRQEKFTIGGKEEIGSKETGMIDDYGVRVWEAFEDGQSSERSG
jgi:hypothetical protein